MQFQSEISNVKVSIPDREELSALGAAYMAGITQGCFSGSKVFADSDRSSYKGSVSCTIRNDKIDRWRKAICLL